MNEIIHYDKPLGFAVLNKSPGIDTYSFVQQMSEPIRAAFADYSEQLLGRRRYDDAHAIHRLDKPTSGCLIVGISTSARRRLTKALANGGIRKTYLAVIHGEPGKSSGIIDAPLAETRVSLGEGKGGYSVIHVDPVNGRRALSTYNVLASNGQQSVVELSPITGRTHQLRVHCAHIGHSIVGDPWYPRPQDEGQKLHLHAARISLLPETFKGLTVVAPMPEHIRYTVGRITLNGIHI